MSDEDVYWGMLLGAAELLCNGVTTACEQYRHPEPVTRALLDSGLRAIYTPAIFDVPGRVTPGPRCSTRPATSSTNGKARRSDCTSASDHTPPTRCLRKGWPPPRPKRANADALLQIHLAETGPNAMSSGTATG